jgi:hypothetical protein
MNLFCENKPSSGKKRSKYDKSHDNLIGFEFDINLHLFTLI